jgi:hypothetical protein
MVWWGLCRSCQDAARQAGHCLNWGFHLGFIVQGHVPQPKTGGISF